MGQWRDSDTETGLPGKSRTSTRMMCELSSDCKTGSGRGRGWIHQHRPCLESLKCHLNELGLILGLLISHLKAFRAGILVMKST